jgi:metal-responsive CopG/Arc/MetJ family transcriptional regulator
MSMNSTVNISVQKELLEEIDKLVNEETRSSSELIREAARYYINKKKK